VRVRVGAVMIDLEVGFMLVQSTFSGLSFSPKGLCAVPCHAYLRCYFPPNQQPNRILDAQHDKQSLERNIRHIRPAPLRQLFTGGKLAAFPHLPDDPLQRCTVDVIRPMDRIRGRLIGRGQVSDGQVKPSMCTKSEQGTIPVQLGKEREVHLCSFGTSADLLEEADAVVEHAEEDDVFPDQGAHLCEAWTLRGEHEEAKV
jgi:hypothetical protein